MRKNSKFNPPTGGQSSKLNKMHVFWISFVLLMIYFLYSNLRSSAFFQKKDRINLVLSQDKFAYYSLGLTDEVNYFIPFIPDSKVIVPGGYGYYRLGALAKLASLEKDPDLFKKTYSMATSSLVDYYFYPSVSSSGMEIIFGKESSNFYLPGFYMLFFGKSNAHFFDRIYLYLHFLGKTNSQFKTVNVFTSRDQGNRTAFFPNDFFESTQGIFYKRSYRSEQRNVQIVYTASYNTAQQLGQILEGEGIRVVDLTGSEDKVKKCEIFENRKHFSYHIRSIS